jgi:lipopolysaccharide export system permease protein
MSKEGTWSSLLGMWISAIILTPLAIYLSNKANNDSALLDIDWYIGRYKHYREKLISKMPEKWQKWLAEREAQQAEKRSVRNLKKAAKKAQKTKN